MVALIHPLGSSAASVVIDLMRSVPPCLLLGSGISQWMPTDLPTGKEFAAAAYEVLFKKSPRLTGREDKLLSKLFAAMPFEHLLEMCPSPEKAATLVNKLYDSHKYNKIHEIFADALVAGKVSSIITTNYDCCLDAALNKYPVPPVSKVITEAQARQAMTLDTPCYFKIHGSIEPGYEHTPLFTLTHEKILPEGKRLLLRKLISGRPLLAIGYSGLDFELCPEIARAGTTRIIWNNYTEDFPSPSAKRLLTDKDGYLLHGDMCHLISEWIAPNL